MVADTEVGNVRTLYLSQDELQELTGYRRASSQLKMLGELGIPAQKRIDNTVLVLRMHLMYPSSAAVPILQKPAPRLKSARNKENR